MVTITVRVMVMDNVTEGEWVTLGEFAKRLGVTRGAIYGRIRRHTLETKPNGNRGYLIKWTPDVTPNDDGNGEGNRESEVAHNVMELRLELARMEERLAAVEDLAAERLETIGDLKRDRDRLVVELVEARHELARQRRPLWERLLEAIRRRP
jgi:hypothetical protein